MGTMVQDLKYGIRMLVKNPGFTAVAVLTLALGIGANSAIFSVVNGVLLQPLPFKDPGRLVALGEKVPQYDMASFSYPDLVDWQDQNHSLEGLAGFNWQGLNLTGVGEAEHVSGKRVTANFFTVLGVPPVLGRNFDRQEDHVGAGAVTMISAGLWKGRFGASPEVIGKTLTLNGQDFAIIGVVPAWFEYRGPADVYTLLGQWDNPTARLREIHPGIHSIGRLKPGATVAQAQSDLSGIAARLAQIYPKSNADHGATVRPLAQEMVGDVRPVLFILFGAVGFVLLIACANVANLLLARATGRQREMAIRAAIGASRGRAIQQLLTESTLLAMAGGGLGLLVAMWGTQGVLKLVPGGLPRMENIRLDGWVLAFTLAVSFVTGIVFGLAPAVQVSQIDLHNTLKEGGRGSTAGHHRMRALLVVSEIAASLVLLVGAGLMLKTIYRLSRVDPGFDPRNLLTFEVGLSPENISTADNIRLAYKRIVDGIETLPGVEAAAVATDVPLTGNDSELPFWVSGRPRPSSQSDMQWALWYPASPGYLRAMGIPLLRGRYFTDQDTKDSAGVVVIDDLMAKGLFPGEDPTGKSIGIYDSSGGTENGLNKPLEIVGVVGHVKHWGLDNDAAFKIRYELYMPFAQIPDQITKAFLGGGMVMLVRTSVDPLSTVAAVRRRIAEQGGGNQPVYGIHTMKQIVSDSVAGRRFSMLLLGIFAALALVLASVGIYGVISYMVGQRTHEIGIRVALGADRRDMLRLVLGQGARLMLLGVGVGLLASFGLTGFLAKYSMLFGVSARDPLTFAGVAVLLSLVALAACFVPAIRAMKVDPVVALRYE
ncbi:MAG: ABC transporter permease [Acidobacteria bacterium]|nr:MAG: ABC transporter permease [Acidobacteriota bacterium]